MVMSELIRVTGHEVGHNWGSPHDPGTTECDNRWLMNSYAQDGSLDTHMVRFYDNMHVLLVHTFEDSL